MRFTPMLRLTAVFRGASVASFRRISSSSQPHSNLTKSFAAPLLIASAGFGLASSGVFAESGWIEVDAFGVDELEDGEMKAVPTGQGKTKILIARVDGKFYAVSNSCTHVGAPMDTGLLVGARVLCPWHNAAFSVITGAAIDMPARDALDSYPVEVRGGRVVVRIPPNAEQRQAIELAMAKPDPAKDPRSFLIVGAGPAAQVAAETLRAEGYAGGITMVTADAAAPYDRTRLSKVLGVPLDKVALRPADWYAQHGVEVLTGKEVKLLDTQSKVAILTDGGQIRFDKVLIATGSTPRTLKVPGANLRNVHTLRTVADSAAIQASATGGKSAVVVGASFIGIEAASALKDALKVERVIVVGMETVPMERVLGRDVGAVVQKMGEDKGVEFIMRRTVARFEGGADGAVRKVVLDNGVELAADVVVVGAGVTPNAGFVTGVPKARDGSITVDGFMRAGADGVYAAGDVATFPYWLTGEKARIEHWNVAMQQGRTAGRNLAGARSSNYTTVPYFWSAFFGGKLNYVGYNGGHETVHIEGDLAARKFIAYYCRDGTVVAAASMGMPNANTILAEALRLGRMPALPQLADGSANLTTIRASLRSAPVGCGRAACCSKPAGTTPA